MAEGLVETYCEQIHRYCSVLHGRGPIRIMEICGTHTMAIARLGLKDLLKNQVVMISGPGCPVCVTDQSYMDQAVMLALGGEAGSRRFDPPIVATYGDLVRVPGRWGSLAQARSMGADVEIVTSTDQAVELAKNCPQRQVVFLAVGFETTAPCTALAVLRAQREGLNNFSVLLAHKRLMPAMHALLASGQTRVDGFLCPGHVSVVIGWGAYRSVAKDYAKPCMVAGFSAEQILAGLAELTRQLSKGEARAGSVYLCVKEHGSQAALKLLDDVFDVRDETWRGLGVIPDSGMGLRGGLARFDAAGRFDLPVGSSEELPGCRCGEVIRGLRDPIECPLFAARCTPREPLGPCMVSSEGPCAAAFKYGRTRTREKPNPRNGCDGTIV